MIDSFGQIRKCLIRKLRGFGCARLLMLLIALDENGSEPQVFAEFDV